jgi:Tol biopolymer transport system component
MTPLELPAQHSQEAEVPTIELQFTRVYNAPGTRLRFPSLSPDGRWIAFSTWGGENEMSLWLLPADGGEAIRLTQGGYDDQPVWFPSGDRIAFRSARPARGENGGTYVMSLPIDPETGRPAGPPRQVSVDECFAWLDVSPDGEWIAFSAWLAGRKSVLVVPSTGGTSRKVAEALTSRPVWSPDGKSIYFVVDRRLGEGEALVRVSADGETTDTVLTWPQDIGIFGYPESRFLLREISSGHQRNLPSMWEVATLDGRPLGRLEPPPAMRPSSFTPAGEILAVRSDMLAPLEVLPIDGGSPRRLNETRGTNEVLGWSADGQRVLFQTTLDGEDMLFFAPTDGGPMRQVRLPEEWLDRFPPVLSQNGHTLLYAAAGPDREAVSLKVLDLADGGTREITDSLFLPEEMPFELSGRGTAWGRDGEDFLYVERHTDRFELRASPPTGPSRLLRTFRGKLPDFIAVHEDRIAFEWGPMDRRSVMFARAEDDEPRALLTLRGYLEWVTWSPDGRRLAVTTYDMPPDGESPEPAELRVMEIDPSGEIVGEPTVLGTPDMVWWSPQWLPSGRGLLVSGNDGNIWRVSTEPEALPVAITADLPDPVWWSRISPDGRSIAYARNIFQGSSIWRVDLGDMLAGVAR